ncbi:MAG: sulfite exporter TauE/SafE family protein [Psychromonas sp.]
MLLFMAYLVLGAIAGLIAGVFGLGGGIIIVPTLIFTFSYLNFPPEVLTHLAVGTSLSTIIFTSLSAIFIHHKKFAVNWALAFKLTLGLLFGAFIGAYFADDFSGELLQRIFALYSLIVALQMWFLWQPKATFILPKKAGLSLIGTFIGFISGLFGIAGGMVTVPILTLYRVNITQAIATAAVSGFPVALSGTIGYIMMGMDNPNLPEYSLGYIYLPATFGIILSSTVFAKIGVSLAHTLPPEKLKKTFAIVLLLVAIKLFL